MRYNTFSGLLSYKLKNVKLYILTQLSHIFIIATTKAHEDDGYG